MRRFVPFPLVDSAKYILLLTVISSVLVSHYPPSRPIFCHRPRRHRSSIHLPHSLSITTSSRCHQPHSIFHCQRTLFLPPPLPMQPHLRVLVDEPLRRPGKMLHNRATHTLVHISQHKPGCRCCPIQLRRSLTSTARRWTGTAGRSRRLQCLRRRVRTTTTSLCFTPNTIADTSPRRPCKSATCQASKITKT